jgi:hypothetical protein
MKTTQTQEINKRIKYMVNLSKQIPWYARKYKELGINPDTIKTPQDLLKAYEKGCIPLHKIYLNWFIISILKLKDHSILPEPQENQKKFG